MYYYLLLLFRVNIVFESVGGRPKCKSFFAALKFGFYVISLFRLNIEQKLSNLNSSFCLVFDQSRRKQHDRKPGSHILFPSQSDFMIMEIENRLCTQQLYHQQLPLCLIHRNSHEPTSIHRIPDTHFELLLKHYNAATSCLRWLGLQQVPLSYSDIL